MSDTPLLDLLRTVKTNKTHGMSVPSHPDYWIYKRANSILDRCKKRPEYMCFEHEKDWMGRGGCASLAFYLKSLTYCSKDLTVDRINPFLGYIKGNLRWADHKTQANNQRRHFSEEDAISSKNRLAEAVVNSGQARFISYKNMRMLISDWCRYLDISFSTVHTALKRSIGYYTESEIIGLYDEWNSNGRLGMVELARIPREKRKNFDRVDNHYLYLGDEKRTINQWARYLGIPRETIKSRIHYGWTDEQIILTPVGVEREGITKTYNYTRTIEVDGVLIPVLEFALRIGQRYETVLRRIELGWDADRIENTPPQVGRNQFTDSDPQRLEIFKQQCRAAYGKIINYHGRECTIAQLCEEKGIAPTTVHSRIARGWTIEKAFDTPVKSKKKTSRT